LKANVTARAAVLLSLILSARMVLTYGSYHKVLDVTLAATLIEQVPLKINHIFI